MHLLSDLWIIHITLCMIFIGPEVKAKIQEKICDTKAIRPVGSVDGEDLKKYENCTVIKNSLILGSEVFKHEKRIKSVDELYVLKNVRIVRGIIHIDLEDSNIKMTNLSFLENLESVIEYETENNSLPLQVKEAKNMEFLGLRSLKNVSGGVWLSDNSDLCYLEPFDWSGIIKLPNKVKGSKSAKKCKEEGKVCDSNCVQDKGCWGPGPTYCRGCKNVKHGHSCMETCPLGFYPDSEKICRQCHSSCPFSLCTGPEKENCKDSCENDKDSCGNLCYRKSSSECVRCNSKCYYGNLTENENVCTGPGKFANNGGCALCSRIILHPGNSKNKECLSLSEPCPRGYYEERITKNFQTYDFAPSLGTLSVCRPCYSNCSSCTGRDMTYPECSSCQAVWVKRRCQKTCEPYLVYDIQSKNGPDFSLPFEEKQCFFCHPQCLKGCTDGTPQSCTKCKNFKVFQSDKDKFTCVEKCPKEKSAVVKQSNGESVCLATAPVIKTTGAGSGSSVWIIVGIIILILLLILLIVIGVILYRKKRSRNQYQASTAEAADTVKNGDVNNEEAKEPEEKDKLTENEDKSYEKE